MSPFKHLFKQASPAWAQKWDTLSPESQTRITNAMPLGKTRQVGTEPFGRGGEGVVYPSVTGKVGPTAIKQHYVSYNGSTGQGKNVMANAHDLQNHFPWQEKVPVMQQMKGIAPEVYGTHPTGYTMERLKPLEWHDPNEMFKLPTQKPVLPWPSRIKINPSDLAGSPQPANNPVPPPPRKPFNALGSSPGSAAQPNMSAPAEEINFLPYGQFNSHVDKQVKPLFDKMVPQDSLRARHMFQAGNAGPTPYRPPLTGGIGNRIKTMLGGNDLTISDIRPPNVMLNQRGKPVLSDFLAQPKYNENWLSSIASEKAPIIGKAISQVGKVAPSHVINGLATGVAGAAGEQVVDNSMKLMDRATGAKPLTGYWGEVNRSFRDTATRMGGGAIGGSVVPGVGSAIGAIGGGISDGVLKSIDAGRDIYEAGQAYWNRNSTRANPNRSLAFH